LERSSESTFLGITFLGNAFLGNMFFGNRAIVLPHCPALFADRVMSAGLSIACRNCNPANYVPGGTSLRLDEPTAAVTSSRAHAHSIAGRIRKRWRDTSWRGFARGGRWQVAQRKILEP
jgi:hypothetical protein